MQRRPVFLLASLLASCTTPVVEEVAGLDAGRPGRDAQSTSLLPEDTSERCRDGLDNDDSGQADCEDPGCRDFVFCLRPDVGSSAGADAAAADAATADAGNGALVDSGGLPDVGVGLDAGCVPQCAGRQCGPDGCGGQCGPGCASGQLCADGACQACAPNCGGRECGPDSTGCSCGSCSAPLTCNTAGRCVCVPSCSGKQCGPDGCGGSCGTCGVETPCVAGRCVCVTQCAGRQCGPDGCGGSCGTCSSGTCTSTGQCCVPSCAGRQCGPDGCGGSCGGCATYCDTATGQCCAPNCAGRQCGPDGCGGSCGTCSTSCNTATGQCCVPNCAGKQCGPDGCGQQCGTCPWNMRCEVGQCIVPQCSPVCADSQWCDTGHVPPVCIEVCNPPVGCGTNEVCVPDPGSPQTGACMPPTCAGAQCQSGQICVDFGESGTPDERCSCLPDYTDGTNTYEDTCWEKGMVCPMDLSTAAGIVPSECRRPTEFEDCLPAVGCLVPPDGGRLDCLKVGTGGEAMCLRACGTGTGVNHSLCLNPATSCYSSLKHCYYNFCVYPDELDCSVSPSGCQAARARFLKPCNAMGTNDGLCQAWAFSDGSEVGICTQGGTATGTCDPDAQRSPGVTTYPTMCTPSGICQAIMPDPANPAKEKGLCRPVCNAAPGTPNPVLPCANTADRCVDISGAPASVTETRLGMCRTNCDLLGTTPCPADALGNQQGCWPASMTSGAGYCRALTPTAAAAGAACAWDDDRRSSCADRLVCIKESGGTSTCHGFCNPALCPNQTTACSSCRPNTDACTLEGVGDLVGYCSPP